MGTILSLHGECWCEDQVLTPEPRLSGIGRWGIQRPISWAVPQLTSQASLQSKAPPVASHPPSAEEPASPFLVLAVGGPREGLEF